MKHSRGPSLPRLRLAPLTGSVSADSTHTVFRTDPGRVIGTVSYMSPEQEETEVMTTAGPRQRTRQGSSPPLLHVSPP